MTKATMLSILVAAPAYAHGEQLVYVWFVLAWAIPAVLFLLAPGRRLWLRGVSVVILSAVCWLLARDAQTGWLEKALPTSLQWTILGIYVVGPAVVAVTAELILNVLLRRAVE